MNVRRVTSWLLLGVLAVLGAWDVYAVVADHSGTISAVVLDASLRAPAIPFAAGFIAGHLFWPQRRP